MISAFSLASQETTSHSSSIRSPVCRRKKVSKHKELNIVCSSKLESKSQNVFQILGHVLPFEHTGLAAGVISQNPGWTNDQRFCFEDLAEMRRDRAASFAGHHLLVIDMLFTQHDATSNNDVRGACEQK